MTVAHVNTAYRERVFLEYRVLKGCGIGVLDVAAADAWGGAAVRKAVKGAKSLAMLPATGQSRSMRR